MSIGRRCEIRSCYVIILAEFFALWAKNTAAVFPDCGLRRDIASLLNDAWASKKFIKEVECVFLKPFLPNKTSRSWYYDGLKNILND